MSPSPTDGNVAARLKVIRSLTPAAIAIAEPSGPPRRDGLRTYNLTTFEQLDQRSDEIAKGLIRWGIQPGMRLAMMVPFGASFIELVFSLLKAGVVAVLIDPGIGRKHLVDCLSESNVDGFVGIPRAQLVRAVLRKRFPTAKWNVTTGRRWLWGGKTLRQIADMGATADASVLPTVGSSDQAAIIFTTGSTGPPKGVLYTHGTFHAQIDRIRERYDIRRGSRDLACFPLFGLFDAVMGVTTVIPDMDPTRPADVNPARLIEAATQWEVDQAFGSPALWNTVVKWCEQHGVEEPFPTLRRVLSAGAPVPASTLQSLRKLLNPDAIIMTPYGATEALPIASIESREVIAETGPASAKGKGVCVGTRFEGVEWRVIEIEDGPITEIQQTKQRPQGKIGELMVAGPMVTTEYVVRSDQNSMHKVRDQDRVWHRMGDCGYLDPEDRFWFCGRKAHRVVTNNRTLFTIPCESVFNAHPKVYRSALVGRGERPNQTPVILVETHPADQPASDPQRETLKAELLELASRNPITRRIQEIIIRSEPLPVDIRHNSKIFRERLAEELPPLSPVSNVAGPKPSS
ncbi:fatty acid CoA ligase family protein [Novipirellula artificiosorum]|uniref:Long-chain-fatty-acid--CoA ligase n=1 Tax=Novipirellula artificiosorum TaxID=2528016 RepID=A0A5C6D9V0_9BACT|nr:fatty acid CoA ligase family protein [Novipirellula artificiosorum]TWU32574.1 Long-chain-fatty-acid--CoA ligase [Novipirellula artificiosorum]